MDDAPPQVPPDPFALHDCAMLVMTTKLQAQDLREFRDGLRQAPESSLYHHFWGRLLSPEFDEPEYSNDFASWAFHGLGEKALAERLSVINPSTYPDMESLREELIEVVEVVLDESPEASHARADHLFYFTHAQLVVFDTGIRMDDPVALAEVAPSIPTSSIYYHFIDARRRTEDRADDFTRWLLAWGADSVVCAQLGALDPFFSSLSEIRREVAAILAPLSRPEPTDQADGSGHPAADAADQRRPAERRARPPRGRRP